MAVTSSKVDAEDMLKLLDCSDLQLVNEIDSLIRENLQSSREPWLLISLIDSYRVSQSKRCMEILATVQEHHCKILLDRITDDIKVTGQQRLQALALFAFIVHHQPPWLYRVAKHPLMNTITKVLKTDSDVPVLMCGVLVLTSIMPVIPVAIASHLSDIFDCFSRLIEFNKKKPGNVPDVYLLHLQVGLYALFHRLYGMYPCNFLTYLRATYSKNDQRQMFEEYIRPMLERVRMHPLLVTASKDKELAVERWRHKEVHDIVVECARMSLDPIEGWSEENLKPIFSNKKAQLDKALPPLRMSIEMAREQPGPYLLEHHSEVAGQPLECQDPFWSPATVCGLSTPPPVPIASPAFNVDSHHTHPLPGLGFVHSTSISASWTSPGQADSPLPHDETERRRLAMLNTHLAVQVQNAEAPPTASTTVPPSPLKPDFTSETPFNFQEMKAIRKINFDNPSSDSQEHGCQVSELASRVRPYTLDVTPAEEAKEDIVTLVKKPETKLPVFTKPSSSTEQPSSAVIAPSVQPPLSSTMPSLTQLPQIIDSLEVGKTPHDRLAEEDIEVSELTQESIVDDVSTDSDLGVPSHIPSSVEMTAESVAAFMKKVNRIRFNSMNMARDKRPRVKILNRSSSCPNLNDISENQPDGSGESGVGGGTAAVRTASPVRINTETVMTQHFTKVTTTTIQTQTSISTTSDAKLKREVSKEPETEAEKFFRYFVETLLVPKCHRCGSTDLMASQNGSSEASAGLLKPSRYMPTSPGGIPIYTTLSPPEMLDRQILLGGEVHAQEQVKIPLTSQSAVSWTHFGGVPPADEVTILRSQLLLLHNQLMFERHKCELHAKRNRRLLGRTVKTVALEEQYSAMQDQLRLQENEIQNLTGALRQQRQESSDSKEAKDKVFCELQLQQKNQGLEIDSLTRSNDQLKRQLATEEEKSRRLEKELQGSRAKTFSLEGELKAIQSKVSLNEELQEQVTRLNKELLLMGELQQKYQQRLTSMAKSHHSKPETQFILESYKSDLAATRSLLDQKTTLLDSTKGKLQEAEENLKQREASLAESKKLLEELRIMHKGELQAIEEKYQTQKKIQLSLHGQILDLYGQVSIPQTDNSLRGTPATFDKKRIVDGYNSGQSSLEAHTSPSPSPVLPAMLASPDTSGPGFHKLQASADSAFKSYQSEKQPKSADLDSHNLESVDPTSTTS